MKIRQKGFTLIELLVVMFLFSLLMLGTTSIMSTVSTAQASVERKLNMAENIRVSSDFLRSVLGNISAQKNKNKKDHEHDLFFKGSSNFIEWLGFMPARYGMGGATYFRLYLQDGNLIISALNWDWIDREIDWSKAHQSVLSDGVQSFSIEYQNARNSVENWVPIWENKKDLPTAIMIKIQTSAGEWPLLIIRVHDSSLSHNDEPTIGGS